MLLRPVCPRRMALLLALVCTASCSVKTNVAGTSTTSPAVNHLYVTVSGLSLNTSSTAKPADSTWLRVTLKTPVTVDLYDPTRSLAAALVSEATVPAGTYVQMRLALVANTTTTASSATALGLSSNNVVVYTTGSGASATVPVEYATQTPSLLLTLPAKIVFKGSTSTSTSASTSGTANSTAPTQLDVQFDALRHLHYVTQTYGSSASQLFAWLGAPAMTLDSTLAGGISGTLDLGALAASTLSSSQGIIATAEQTSADGTRNVEIASAVVQVSGTAGTFTIYPLPAVAGGTTTYDIVIHGPGVQTMIVQSVPVSAGLPTATTSLSTGSVALVAAPTYSVYMPAVSTTAGGVVAYANGNATVPLPAAAEVGFYETLNTSVNKLPYRIEGTALNPLTRQFSATDAPNSIGTTTSIQTNFVLTNANVLVGTYTSTGAVTFAEITPAEGTGSYLVSASAPLHTPSPLVASASTPVFRVVPGTNAQPIYPLAPAPASGTSATLSVSLPAGTYLYDNATLVISAGGLVVDAVDLAQALATASGATLHVGVAGLPVGTPGSVYTPAVYDMEVRAWQSGAPNNGVHYSWLNGVDMTNGIAPNQVLSLP